MKCATFGYRLRAPRCPTRRVIPRRALRGIRCESSSSAANDFVKVKFTIPHHVEFGQSVCVLGSAAELGDWQVEKSQCLTWNEGDVWSGVVELPPSEVEYKYFTKNPDGTPAEWQPCENLSVLIDGEEMEVVDEWNGTQQTATTEEELTTEPEVPTAPTESVTETEIPTPEPVVAAVEAEEELEEAEPVVEEASIPESVQELAEEVVSGAETSVKATSNATKGTLSA